MTSLSDRIRHTRIWWALRFEAFRSSLLSWLFLAVVFGLFAAMAVLVTNRVPQARSEPLAGTIVGFGGNSGHQGSSLVVVVRLSRDRVWQAPVSFDAVAACKAGDRILLRRRDDVILGVVPGSCRPAVP